MRIVGALLFILTTCCCHADTIGKYASIAKGIPQMQLRADSQSQAWARSARSILAVTEESIAQTIDVINQQAIAQGRALVCLPEAIRLNGKLLHKLLSNNLADLTDQQKQLSVSSVALAILQQRYPCPKSAQQQGQAMPSVRMESVRAQR